MQIFYFADIRFPLERANGIQTMETCHALAKRGHIVTLVVRPDRTRPARDPFAFYGLDPIETLKIARVRNGAIRAITRARYIASAVREAAGSRRLDLLYTRDLGVASVVLRMPRTLRPPLVYESHGFAPAVAESMPHLLGGAKAVSSLKSRRLLSRERFVWLNADGYVTITTGLAMELEGRFGSRPHVAIVRDATRLPSGRRFTPPVAHDPPIVAYAGHLYPWKGVDVLLRALARLRTVRGLIVGGHTGERDLDRVRTLATLLDLGTRLQITGLVPPPRVSELIGAADVLVLPNTLTTISASYTSPLKLFEYLATGKPIVASDLPAIREVVSPDEHAVLVPPGDPDALAAGIARVLDDPAFATRLAHNAFDRAARYSWDARAEHLDQFFRAMTDSTSSKSV
ncbi:MAG: glycosyltransferase family 4 protein [Acidobacteria bacterium]|nr:glycosyltransferase family 4 protein [Acidobacteriota bacterium]